MSESKKKEEQAQTLKLSSEDEQVMREVLQKMLQAASEHSQLRSRFVQTTKEYEAITKKFNEDEAKALDTLKLLAQEQHTTLKQLGQRMKVPEGHQLNLNTMTWEKPPTK